MPLFLRLLLLLLSVNAGLPAEPGPVPRMQVVPLPRQELSFQRDGQEIARYYHGPEFHRPFVYPMIGPSGRSLTRFGHPNDPHGHRHHYSVWIAHKDVNGVSFWEDEASLNVGRIVHQRTEMVRDADAAAFIQAVNAWVDKSGRTVLTERRRTTAISLPDREWLLVVDVQFNAAGEPVTFGKTSLGLFAVRVAAPMSVQNGGRLRNSSGETNEKAVFGKPARWMDFSGAIATGTVEGVTLLDHPINPGHPTSFHVRDEGWMCSSLTFNEPRVVTPGKPLVLRYGVLVHAGQSGREQLDERWREFSQRPLTDFKVTKR